ncbi:MAG: NACHT domain-containing protein [Cyanobacteria bacterium P01_F01_bin.143]
MSKKILILAANPRGDLRNIDREIRDLKKAIARNKNSDEFEIETEVAVLSEDLQGLIYDNQPYIVHFCGHGTGEDGLVFVNEDGKEELVSNDALAELFRILGKDIECVLLNACHTETQVDLIVEHIPFAIGTSKEILDKAAYWFSIGFYKALVRKQPIEVCYEWGCNAVQIKMPNLKFVSESTGRFRKLIAIAQDDTEIESEPLKIVLKQKPALESTPQTFAPEIPTPEIKPEAKVIPPDIEAELQLEQEIKDYQDLTRTAIDNLGNNSNNLVIRKPITRTEYRQRQTLLNKVKEFWIDGFLKPSLYTDNAINLELESRPDAILRPELSSEVLPIELDESFAELQQTDIYQQVGQGKTLLILGEPGSGKTITLLQLAEHLIEQTTQDLTKPIPIVFNLSSWGQAQQPLEKWLIEEFKDKYQVPKLWSEQWLKEEQLILLLDGLDEVQVNQRNACVRAINDFVTSHNLTETIVCSRAKDYEALSEKLQLSSAICLKPLSSAQVYSFLDTVGESLSELKTLLRQDEELEQFAQTPLILNVMSLAYQGWSTEDLLKELRSTDNRYSHLFDSYIQRMLNRKVSRSIKSKYSKQKVVRWLSWLAKKMVRESRTVFLIEKLQPTLLQNRGEIISYKIRNFLIGGLIYGLIEGLIYGIIIGVYSWRTFGIILGLTYGRLFGLIVFLNFGLIAGLIICLQKEIILFEHRNWSWQKAKLNRVPEALILGLIGAIIVGITGNLGGLIGLIIGLVMIINDCFNYTEVNDGILPNQGIGNSIRNSFEYGIILGAIVLIFFESLAYILGDKLVHYSIDGLLIGTFTSLLLAIKNGGATGIQHFNLRRILHKQGHIPWNYARFLDYATELLLMKKVGGGYVFYHRMLMEHFANMDLEQ